MNTEKKVGMAFFVGIALLMALTFWVGKIRLFENGYIIKVNFSQIGGLKKGDTVTLAGMKVGRVEDFDIKDNKIQVSLWIKNSKQGACPCHIRIKSEQFFENLSFKSEQ